MTATDSVVADGLVVSIHYTLKAPDGTLLDSSEGSDPLLYLHGAENIVPGLEKQLTGKAVGDKVVAVVPAAEGYGERTGPEPQKVPRTELPADADLIPGMQIIAESGDGQAFPLWIVEADDEHFTVDHNHPLAGVTLHFDVEIAAIRAATDEEKAHGHPHGPDGHDHHHH